MIYYIFCALVILVITYFVTKAVRVNNYFKEHGIPHFWQLPLREMLNFLTGKHTSTSIKELYNMDKRAKYVGCEIFFSKGILIRDLDLIKSVLVKNFDHFANKPGFLSEEIDPFFGKNLAFVNGGRWKELRNMLSPAFTSNKMKSMYVLMSKCAENFVDQVLERYGHAEAVDLKDLLSKYATDVIATCAYGIEIDSVKNPNNDFYRYGKKLLTNSIENNLKFMLLSALPAWLVRKLNLTLMPKEDREFFIDTVGSVMRARKEKGIERPDMIQLMMDAQDKLDDLSIEEMASQAFLFFLAGFDSVASQMCMIAHELVANPDIQLKLQEEIDAAVRRNGGALSYELVNGMPYLNAVFSETLRLHPQAIVIRQCSKEFELPPCLEDSRPYVVKPGMNVIVPVAGIHADPDYYENPGKFDPERFVDKSNQVSNVLNLGFGMGPRMCLGNRFAILEAKVLFAHLLRKANLLTCDKTCLPLVYEPRVFQPVPKGGCWLRFEKRK